jgi:hypothetical protein
LQFSLALCVLIAGLAPGNAMAQSGANPPGVAVSAPGGTAVQHTLYRWENKPDGTVTVQRSEDGGATWLAAGAIPEQVVQLQAAPGNDALVLARTASGLWRSKDGGASWVSVTRLPDRPLAMALAASGDPSGLIFLGTASKGLYVSDNFGDTWRTVGGPFALAGPGSLAVGSLAINPEHNSVIYAGASFTMATPEGSHTGQFVFISVDDGRRWFEMRPALGDGEPAKELSPVAGLPLSVSVLGPAGSQMLALDLGKQFTGQLDGSDPETRAAAALALGLSHDRTMLPLLLAHLDDPDAYAGDQVAEAIGLLGDSEAKPELLSDLDYGNEVLSARAAHALGLLHAEEAIPQLGTMLRTGGPIARPVAAKALANIGTPAAIAALIEPLHDAGTTASRESAMQGLELAGQPAVEPLRAALRSPDPVLRRNSAEMLGWLSPASAAGDLTQALSDPDPDVRSQATWALAQIAARSGAHASGPAAATAPRQAPGATIDRQLDRTETVYAEPVTLVSKLSALLSQVTLKGWTLVGFALLLALAAIMHWKGPRQMHHLGRS